MPRKVRLLLQGHLISASVPDDAVVIGPDAPATMTLTRVLFGTVPVPSVTVATGHISLLIEDGPDTTDDTLKALRRHVEGLKPQEDPHRSS